MTTPTSIPIADLGHTPESLRALRGFSAAYLAERAKVGRSTVARIENGETTVNLGKVAKVAAVLRVTTSELVTAMANVKPSRRSS